MMSAVMMETKSPSGLRSTDGGVIPQRTSRTIPPPTPVMTASTVMPKISIRRDSPTTAPEKAKAMVPSVSKMSQVMVMGDPLKKWKKGSGGTLGNMSDIVRS